MASRLDQIVSEAALKYPDNIALIEPGMSITYSKLEENICLSSNYLSEEGLQRGDRVGILGRNSIASTTLFFAVSRAGGISVPLNYTLDPLDIVRQADNCAISALYIGEGLEDKGKAVADEKVRSIKFTLKDSEESAKDESSPAARPDDPAIIIYTSGTTGDPLGVTLSHKNIISNSISVTKYMGLGPDDRVFCVLPFYYIFGLSLLFSCFSAGGSLIIDNRFMYPSVVLDAMDELKATAFAGVSSHYAILLRLSDFKKRKLPYLKCFMQAGDSLPPLITKELVETFPDKKLYIMYGQTEAAPRLTYLDPALAEIKPGSIGKAIPGVEIKLVKEDGSECHIGEEGEIIARGDNIMLGYWNNPGETSKVMKDGWLYTGDLAIKDKDGDLFITGRKKSFVKVGANRVNPVEIEQLVLQDGRVLEAAAVGIDDAILGKKIGLFISLIPGAKISVEEIMKLCKSRLPAYKAPFNVAVLESLPKNSYGKIDTKKLMEAK